MANEIADGDLHCPEGSLQYVEAVDSLVVHYADSEIDRVGYYQLQDAHPLRVG